MLKWYMDFPMSGSLPGHRVWGKEVEFWNAEKGRDAPATPSLNVAPLHSNSMSTKKSPQ
jgi:hypothetical protein